MIKPEIIKQICAVWDNYSISKKIICDTKGNEIPNIDGLRLEAIKQLKVFIQQFLSGSVDIYEFKTNVDSFNKRNNLWGFTAIKGQMFFNVLLKNTEKQVDELTGLLKECIVEPLDLQDALEKIGKLESYCYGLYEKSQDKRKVANPNSIGYFLSYFWQIQNPEKWAILFTSQIKSYEGLGIWEEKQSQKDTYLFFYQLNEEIRAIIENYSKSKVSNWDIEHIFYNHKDNPIKGVQIQTFKESKSPDKTILEEKINIEIVEPSIKASFELMEYLIPKVTKLMDLGNQIGIASSKKGKEFEKLVAEIFKQLDFDVEEMGQGTGRNPDAILRFREENTAFLVDAKAYNDGYTLGVDDRAIKEYIAYYCPKLYKEGYKKIGFIIVSNSFKSNFDGFINTITWNTEIKRFILLTSEALLYLLAFKTKDRLPLSTIINSLVGLGNLIEAKDIISEFEDV